MAVISLVIPVFNVEKYIDACLQSCIRQTYSNIEMVCVDDCSTDNSIERIRYYSSLDSRIRIVKHEKNIGLGGARNTGMLNATGDYVWFIDSDDEIEQEACATIIEALEKFPSTELAFVGLKTIDGGSEADYFPTSFDVAKVFFSTDTNYSVSYLLNKEAVSACLKIVKRTFLLRSFRFLEAFQVEDIPTIFLAFSANGFCIIPEYLYRYRRNRPGSITNEFSWKFHLGYIENLLYLFSLLETYNSPLAEEIRNSYSLRAFQFQHVYFYWRLSIGKQRRKSCIAISEICKHLNKADCRIFPDNESRPSLILFYTLKLAGSAFRPQAVMVYYTFYDAIRQMKKARHLAKSAIKSFVKIVTRR